jgi:hypothetical protein
MGRVSLDPVWEGEAPDDASGERAPADEAASEQAATDTGPRPPRDDDRRRRRRGPRH